MLSLHFIEVIPKINCPLKKKKNKQDIYYMQRNKNQVRNAKSIEAISVTSVAAVCSLETRVRAAASCPSQIHYGTMSVVTSVTSKPVPSRRKRAECFEREEPPINFTLVQRRRRKRRIRPPPRSRVSISIPRVTFVFACFSFVFGEFSRWTDGC